MIQPLTKCYTLMWSDQKPDVVLKCGYIDVDGCWRRNVLVTT